MPEQDIPKFETKEEYQQHLEALHKGAALLNAQKTEEKPNEDLIKEMVLKQVDEAKKSIVDEKEARLTKVFLGDENNINAIKKTFKDDKDYETWNKEAQEGKASNKEIELLVERGKKIIESEAKEAEKAKEAEVAKAKEVSETPQKRTLLEAYQAVDKIQTDEKSAFVNIGQYKTKEEQHKRLEEECKQIASVLETVDVETLSPADHAKFRTFNETIHNIKTDAVKGQEWEAYAKTLRGNVVTGFGSNRDMETPMNPDGSTIIAEKPAKHI